MLHRAMKAERVVFAGECRAEALVLDEPLSFWGGLDPETGRIIDEQHPQKGQCVTGRILLMPGTRGSTSAAGALCECLRLGTGPAAFILPAADVLILAAVTVAAELYGRVTPVLSVDMAIWPELTGCKMLHIETDGTVSEILEISR